MPASTVHLSHRRQATYSLGESGIAATEIFVQLFLYEYYVALIGLSPIKAGLAFALAVVWDALSDPLLGYWSDRRRQAGGSRTAFLWAGVILIPLGLAATFQTPPEAGQWTLFAQLLGAYLLLNTGTTCFAVPHLSLAADVPLSQTGRNRLFGWRFLLSNVGIILALVINAVWAQSETLTQSRQSASLILAACVALLLAACLPACYALQRQSPPETTERKPFALADFAALLPRIASQRVFQVLFVAFCLAAIARALNASLALLYYRYCLEITDETFINGILLAFVVTLMAAVPLWLWIARRLGRRRPAFFGILALALMTLLVYPNLEPGIGAGLYAVSLFAGLCAAAVFLLEALFADHCHSQSQASGENREGLYFGLWRMAYKLARALGLLLTGFLLQWVGFREGSTEQSPETIEGLHFLFGPVVGLIFLASAISLLFLTKEAKASSVSS